MIGLGTAGWYFFTERIIESKWFFGEVGLRSAFAFALPLVVGGLGAHALLEWKGRRFATLVFILSGNRSDFGRSRDGGELGSIARACDLGGRYFATDRAGFGCD